MGFVQYQVILFLEPLYPCIRDGDQVSTGALVYMCNIMLDQDGTCIVCYVVLCITFISVYVAYGDVSSISCLFLVDVCLQYVGEVLVLFQAQYCVKSSMLWLMVFQLFHGNWFLCDSNVWCIFALGLSICICTMEIFL